MIDRLHGYPKVWNLGHAAIANLFDGDVVIQEKVDGSQFAFGMINGELRVRSKGREIHLPVTDKLFKGACETAQRLFDEGKLREGWQYRGEVLCGPRHNALTYERAPDGNIILFDVDTGLEDRVSEPSALAAIGAELGLEVVPTIYRGTVTNLDDLKQHLDRVSVLGGVNIEGIVMKNYTAWGRDGKMLMGKLVSDAFREVHSKEWKKAHPGRGDVIQKIKETYRSHARWEKAIQHRTENGELENSPKDIGPLLREIQVDLLEECREEISEILFDAFWKEIGRGACAGFPEWYKQRLAELQFETSETVEPALST